MNGRNKKKSPFWFFVMNKMKKLRVDDDQKVAVGGVAAGRDFPSTASLVGPEWERMTRVEREPYVRMADKHNARRYVVAEEDEDDPGQQDNVGHNSNMRLDVIHEGHLATKFQAKDKTEETKSILQNFVDKGSLGEMPIVICKFNTYWKISCKNGNRAIPSEIALSVFSIERGVYDNFCSLIDPGPAVPEEYEPYRIIAEVEANCKKQHMFMCNYSDELQDYEGLLSNICRFLDQHISRKVVFCRPEDMNVTEASFLWLCKRSGLDSSDFEVFNLNSLMQMLSMEAYAAKSRDKDALTITSTTKISRAQHNAKIEAWNKKKEIVGGVVAYPSEFPLIQSKGVFVEEAHVDALLSLSNYEFYEELACPYHCELIDGSQYCPLNTVNRYAFGLLDALLPNFGKAIPQPGSHYPWRNHLNKEVLIRQKMIENWSQVCYKGYAKKYKEYIEDEEEKKKIRDREFEAARLLATPSEEFKYIARKSKAAKMGIDIRCHY